MSPALFDDLLTASSEDLLHERLSAAREARSRARQLCAEAERTAARWARYAQEQDDRIEAILSALNGGGA